ncbi:MULTISPECIES: FG-GAP and VCBS repeat-containing protein [Streptomyces]|uniref:FG-GAP and VCBS repeat-containing protein n=1 Tax=Streptomyces TaxID=1883 RepID=UPI001E5DAEDB|nr:MULTISPECIES: FG-GAP and VCBS repeat-containing protein [Streptomyces]UFQ19033.1 VCBS repeat-containing protein [Streptomyces huasconensis]WCL88652.1 FG-GAP and VCBS repeat-containing protein [Streptomyces sp. JCM 35825]
MWSTAAPAAVKGPDFNGDGYADAVVGVYRGDVDGKKSAGYLHVLYGGPRLGGRPVRLVRRTIAQGQAGSGAGSSLAVGDFTQDSAMDVAVGLPHGEFGEVTLRPGPLTEDKPLTRLLHTGFDGTAGRLAAGDLDGNGRTELAVSAYSNDDSRTTLWRRNGSALREYWKSPATGYDMAAGDFDGDNVDDLALGHCLITAEADRPTGACGPDELAKGGKVRVLYGSADAEGFGTRSHTIGRETPGVAGTAEEADSFGIKLAAGDLTGDGRDDLVAGTPAEGVGAADRAGSATVLTSGPTGLPDASGTAKSAAWHQDSAGVPGAPEVNDEFGSALALGDYDGDGDITVGVFNEDSTEYEQTLSSGGVWTLPNGAGTGSKALTARLFGLRGALYYGQALGH